MGKTSKPLNILAHPDVYLAPGLDELRTQGHTIDLGGESGPSRLLADYDLILGPNCCWCTKEHLPYILKIMIPKVRKVKYAQKDTKDS